MIPIVCHFPCENIPWGTLKLVAKEFTRNENFSERNEHKKVPLFFAQSEYYIKLQDPNLSPILGTWYGMAKYAS